nr:shikimate kinase [Evansella caseinilytica]
MFIGFMGVGKTTIGNLVAKKLYRDFIDIDQEIERKHKMPVTEIFKQIGEKAFRQMEKEVITELCQKKLKVISVGGGAFLQEEVREICLSSCIVFYLDLSWGSWKDRISLIVDSRPVLQGKSLEDMEKLFHERKAIYSTHHSKINTDKQEAEEIADYIVDSLKLAWELYE